MILNRYQLIPFLILLFVINLFGTALADSDDDWGGFLPSGQYYTILDPDGRYYWRRAAWSMWKIST